MIRPAPHTCARWCGPSCWQCWPSWPAPGRWPRAPRRTGQDTRPVLHRHRADHLRDRRQDPRGHPRIRRRQRRRPSREAADPRLRVPARGEGAGHQRVAASAHDLANLISGPDRGQADGRLRARSRSGLRRPAGGRMHRDRHGVLGEPRARSRPRASLRRRLSRATSGSSPSARPATPTCCWGCSIGTPTSGWSARPTRPCTTSWPRTCQPSRRRTR